MCVCVCICTNMCVHLCVRIRIAETFMHAFMCGCTVCVRPHFLNSVRISHRPRPCPRRVPAAAPDAPLRAQHPPAGRHHPRHVPRQLQRGPGVECPLLPCPPLPKSLGRLGCPTFFPCAARGTNYEVDEMRAGAKPAPSLIAVWGRYKRRAQRQRSAKSALVLQLVGGF